MNTQSVAAMGNDELVEATRELARRSCAVEAELLIHLGEIDQRRLYLDRAFPSMFAFCTRELGFSEGAAYNRILVARAARKLPAVIDAVRSGSVHLAGLRLLAPHLTDENHLDVLRQAAGRSKEQIGELVAALAPRPPLRAMLRKLPDQCGLRLALAPQGEAPVDAGGPSFPAPAPQGSTEGDQPPSFAAAPSEPPRGPPTAPVEPPRWIASAPPEPARRHPADQSMAPFAADTYRLHLTIPRELRDEIREAQDLLRHRVPDGDLAKIFRMALKTLLAKVKKERFAVGRKARGAVPEGGLAESRREPAESRREPAESRHVPDAMKRAVYERDGGRCAFTDARGRRCEETAALEIDHVEGFARTHHHDIDGLRLLCRAHNQHAADRMYGRAFMEAARQRTGPGTSVPCEETGLDVPRPAELPARYLRGAQPEPCYTDTPCTFAPSSGPPPRA
jgi:hypothetical protein